jgi:ubiquinone/menaquinone biosynthesis C-methylase UbiE
MRRTVIPELLDFDSGTPEEIASSMADLRRINRLFGGISTMQYMISRIVKQIPNNPHTFRELSLLDVAAASGDGTFAACTRLARRGIRVVRTLLDRSPAHLPSNGIRPRQADTQAPTLVVGDALRLPFADASFDLVTCSLFVHHLEPEQVVRFLEESLRVCRTAVLINDLRRSAISLALTYMGLVLFRSRLTRHDAIASVRRAYNIPEITTILRQFPACRIEVCPHYLFRMSVIVWKAQ